MAARRRARAALRCLRSEPPARGAGLEQQRHRRRRSCERRRHDGKRRDRRRHPNGRQRWPRRRRRHGQVRGRLWQRRALQLRRVRRRSLRAELLRRGKGLQAQLRFHAGQLSAFVRRRDLLRRANLRGRRLRGDRMRRDLRGERSVRVRRRRRLRLRAGSVPRRCGRGPVRHRRDVRTCKRRVRARPVQRCEVPERSSVRRWRVPMGRRREQWRRRGTRRELGVSDSRVQRAQSPSRTALPASASTLTPSEPRLTDSLPPAVILSGRTPLARATASCQLCSGGG